MPPVSDSPAPAPYIPTPDDFLAQLQIETPHEHVSIKGVVERLTPYAKEDTGKPQWVYGVLRGVDAAIGFRCPAWNTPTFEGEPVVLTGHIVVRPSRFHDGLDVLLYGEPTGTWLPSYSQADGIIRLEKRHTRLPLSTLVRNQGLNGLCILASRRGASDLLSAAQRHGLDLGPNVRTCRFDQKDPLLKAVRDAAKDTAVKAIAFARGGSDDATLRLWNDAAFLAAILDTGLPFYTAIGHSDVLLLADKYGDESFTTPTALGDSLGQILAQLEKEQRQDRALRHLYRERDELNARYDTLRAGQRHLQRWLTGLIAVIAIGVIGILYAVADRDAATPTKIEKTRSR